MKTIFSIIIVSLLFISINAQSKLTDKEIDGLKGKVKSIVSSSTDIEIKEGKRIEKKSGIKYEEHYDEKGNTSVTLNNIVGDKNIYSIIDGDKTFKTVKIEGVGGSGISASGIAEYKKKTRDERYSIRYKYKYDDKNRVIEETLYNNDGELNSRRLYKYDEKNRVKEIETYNTYKSDKITSRASLKYDNENNLIEDKTTWFINGERESQSTYSDYKFDAQDNWIERTYIYKRDSKSDSSKTIQHRKIEYYGK